MLRMNILVSELHLNRRSLVIWTIVSMVIVGIYLGFFPYYDASWAEVIDSMPPAFLEAFSFSGVMFEDVNLYHGGLVLMYVLVAVSIYGFMLAGSLIARESDWGTAEFLLVMPVTRMQILLAKATAFVVLVSVLWLVIFITSTLVGVAVAGRDFHVGAQVWAHLAGLLATMAAGGIAFAVAPFIDRTQTSTSLGVGVGLGFFLLDAVRNMIEVLDPLKYLSIHYYAELQGAATGEPFTIGLLVLPAIFIIGTLVGLFFLQRKEFTV